MRAVRLLLVFLGSLVALRAGAETQPVWVAKVLRQVPRTEPELAAAFAASKDACVQVPAADPLELAEIGAETFYDVTRVVDGQPLKEQRRFEFARLGVLSFGSRLLPDDQQQLPALSKSRILRRVAGDYVALQVRLHRDAESGDIYLYHKPLAAVGSFGQPDRAQEFAPVMEDSVRQVRGLGLFVDPELRRVEADNLRTLVAVSQSMMVARPEQADAVRVGAWSLVPTYRLIFVRARSQGNRFALHTFVTSHDGTTWAYLPPYQPPSSAEDCTVTSDIVFTGYTAAKQSPNAKASRSLVVHERARYSVAGLDAWLAGQGVEGGACNHLTAALDAIIDGRVAAVEGP